MTDKKHVFLVDGSGFLFRAFHALPPMSSPTGTPVNAVFGFTKMLLKLVEDTEADFVGVIFDHKRKTFRSDIYADYKANRPPPPEELVPQFDLVRDAVRAMNVASIEMAGFEADDLIATYARQAHERGDEVTIVSSDKDLMQLVNDSVTMLDAMKSKVIGPDQVVEKFGVTPDKVVDVQALAGDSTDNVPGVAGIGVKTAAQLINDYGDLEGLLSRAEEIKQPKRRQNLIEHADMARISQQLVRLKDDVPVEHELDSMAKKPIDGSQLLAFVQHHGFKSLITTIASRHGGEIADTAGDTATPAAGPVEKSYELVQSMAALTPWIDEAYRVGTVAVDTETSKLSSMEADLVGVSLSTEAGKACYIPLGHRKGGAQGGFDFGDGGVADESGIEQIPLADALKALKPMLEDRSILKVGQNIKYDMQVLARYGIDVHPIDDTMLLSYVVDGGLHGHGMDELAETYLDYTTIKFKEVAGSGKSQISFAEVELDKALDYAAEDADVTLRLHTIFKPRLVEDKMATVYETFERPLVPVLERMERRGIKVDAQVLNGLSTDFAARMADLETEIHKLAGREFNVGSPKQLGEILFEDLGLEGGKKGKTGAYATGAEVLEGLAAEGYELPQKALDWRQLQKLKSTYTDALIDQINPETGRVHTSYSQAVTSTGRLSSTDPNLQNIPIRTEEGRKIRQAFVAPPGHMLVSADYSQIELRLLAHVAGIEVLNQAFHDGQDIHALTASQVFGIPVEGMDPMVRRRAKAINFGIIYGISAFGLARQLQIPRGEAGDYIKAYFEKYPGIKDYMDATKELAKSQGYVMTPFGRRCHVKGMNDRNPNMRGFAERAAINAPIQGGAADIIKKAMIRLEDALAEKGLGAKMLLQVHDELIFEVPETELDETKAAVAEVMSGAATLSVPLDVDAGHGPSWAEAH